MDTRRRLGLSTVILLVAAAVAVAQPTSAVAQPSCAAFGSSIVTGADGNLWITESGDDEVARVPSDGGAIAEFPLGIPGLDAYSVLGPDGNVWVLASGTSIARVAPDGHIDTFPLPAGSAPSSPLGLAVGPDRNLWARRSVDGSQRLTRVNPAGMVTDFPISVTAGTGLAATADALWFFDRPTSNSARMYRANTNAKLTLVSTLPGRSDELVAASDGTLWSLQRYPDGSARLVHLTSDGVTAGEFAIPVPPGRALESLIIGPDDRLWLVMLLPAGLLAMDTSGTWSTYTSTAALAPRVITAGPDGDVWFAGTVDVGSVSTAGNLLSSRSIPVSTGSANVCTASPKFGHTSGGDVITLRGRGLDNVTNVWFGPNAATSFSIVSDRELMATTPGHPRGEVTIEIDTPAGREASSARFRYAEAPMVSSVDPVCGPLEGGWVHISGDDVDIATIVSFGGTQTTDIQVFTDDLGLLVRVKAPAHTSGVVRLQAFSPLGWGPEGAAFTYVPAAPPGSVCQPYS